jgi:hypothetical protein
MVRVLKLKNKSKIKGKFRIITSDPVTKEIIHTGEWQENLISNADTHGHNLIIRHLYGDVTYPLEITRARFGTVNTAPTSADTDIASPLAYDIEIASRSITSATEVQILFFAPTVYIPDDTYYTFGVYAGNKIFGMHLLDTPLEKVGATDITIEYSYQVTNS